MPAAATLAGQCESKAHTEALSSGEFGRLVQLLRFQQAQLWLEERRKVGGVAPGPMHHCVVKLLDSRNQTRSSFGSCLLRQCLSFCAGGCQQVCPRPKAERQWAEAQQAGGVHSVSCAQPVAVEVLLGARKPHQPLRGQRQSPPNPKRCSPCWGGRGSKRVF